MSIETETRFIDQLEKQMNDVLNYIADTSYGIGKSGLWEVLGRIQYLTSANLATLSRLREALTTNENEEEELEIIENEEVI